MNIQDIQHVLNNAALHQRNERPNHADLCNQAAVAVGEIGKQRDALLAACQFTVEQLEREPGPWDTTIHKLTAAIAKATGGEIAKAVS